MHKAIEILMGEHRLIERVLGSLETFAAEAEGGRAAERRVVADYAGFFRGFADACHHGKEEDILFQRMLERGFSRESGPIAVMLEEHRVGREHVGALRRVGEGTGLLSSVDTQIVVENASQFVPLLRTHILKEDRVLYPMALRVLTGAELDAIATGFEALERTWRAEGTYDRLQGLADTLSASFRPDPARTAGVAEGAGCGAR